MGTTGSGTGTPTSGVTEPITTAQAKAHLRVDHSNDDTYIEGLITVARKRAEQITHRKFIQETLTGYLDAWPKWNSIVMPFGNLQSVTSVKYTDTAGSQTTWSADEYNVSTVIEPGRIQLEYGYHWPSVSLHPTNPIEIIFVAGYGSTADTVPDMIKHAIKILLSDLYENREDVIVGMTVTANLKAAQAMLFPYTFWPVSPVKVLQS